MISNLQETLSINAQGLKRSVIRELLKLTADPELISFAGGLPSPDTFPVEQLKIVVDEVLEKDAKSALQYGATEGDTRLRELLVEKYQRWGLNIGLENLVITTASQQGLDLLSKLFINPGDKVIVGLPSYLAGLSSFRFYGGEPVGIKFDENGMRSDLLEIKVKELIAEGKKPKFIYVIPDFQNPAGVTMPEFRRKEIIEIAKKYDILIVEDSPYRELRFEGEDQAMINALDNSGHVITLGTFSKIFVPGFRLGWVVAHKDVADKFVMVKQSSDLCTSPFVQKIAAKYIEKGFYEQNLKKTIAMYKNKKDIMMKAFREYMPDCVSWTNPDGGLFLFLLLPEHMDAQDLFLRAIKEKVAFVIGSVFHCDGKGKNTLRINFSYASEKEIVEGVKRLALAIKKDIQ